MEKKKPAGLTFAPAGRYWNRIEKSTGREGATCKQEKREKVWDMTGGWDGHAIPGDVKRDNPTATRQVASSSWLGGSLWRLGMPVTMQYSSGFAGDEPRDCRGERCPLGERPILSARGSTLENLMGFRLFFVGAACLLAGRVGLADDMPPRPTIGAIRWDGWFTGNPWQRNLNPKQWHDRLPFYGKEISDSEVEVCGDTQQVMDQEIAFAHAAGLDYWAFLHYHPTRRKTTDSYNYGLRLYLSSKHKAKVNFAVIIYPVAGEEWLKQVADVVRFVREPSYQKVAAGRPLIYLLAWGERGLPEKVWGPPAKGREAVAVLRKSVSQAGQKNPYLVVQAVHTQDAARYADELGLDAISSYANSTGDSYADLAAVNRRSWEEWRASGKKVVPLVNAGWNPRPRNQHGGPEPKPAELREHLRSAIGWVKKYREAADAQTILIYAWNESDEGGWLVPTKSEGTARLDALREALRGPGASEGR